MLLGSRCAVCRRPRGPVCQACASYLRRAAPTPAPRGVDGWTSLLRYDEGAAAVVTALKNGQRRDLVAWLAGVAVADLPRPGADVVTWAPTGPDRRRVRGFDHAELMARALARRWSLPCRALLRRAPGPPQSGRSGAERRTNPAFRSIGRVPARVLVVDDVATTGATLTAAAAALRARHAEVEVTALVLAAVAPVSSWRP